MGVFVVCLVCSFFHPPISKIPHLAPPARSPLRLTAPRAPQVLPPLLDVIPEARLNLVVYHLKHGEIQEAFDLMKDLEPTTPSEYILKGVIYASMGQVSFFLLLM